MQSSIFIKGHEFEPSVDSLTFRDVDWGSTGFGTVVFKYKMNDLLIQSPKMKTPFGFSKGIPGTNSYGRDFNCQFNLDDSTQKVKSFREGLEKMQDVIVRHAYENRVEWGLFGNKTEAQNATLADVREKFSPMVRLAKDPQYPPTFKTSFRLKKVKDKNEWEITTECHDDKNKHIEPSEKTIPRRCQCIVIIRGRSIWISPDRKFGLKWQIERIKVYPPEETGDGGGGGDSFETKVSLPTGTCMLNSDSESE